MDDRSIDLFDSDASSPLMPSLKDMNGVTSEEIKKQLDMGSELISSGIDKAISGKQVKTMMLAEDPDIMLPNFVIDFTDVEELHNYQMEGLDALLHPDGDTWIYVYTKNGGLTKLGRGRSEIVDRILTLAIAKLFDSKCKVYRNFEVGKKLNIVSNKDITTMRLSI